jgi:hypothetical protein
VDGKPSFLAREPVKFEWASIPRLKKESNTTRIRMVFVIFASASLFEAMYLSDSFMGPGLLSVVKSFTLYYSLYFKCTGPRTVPPKKF